MNKLNDMNKKLNDDYKILEENFRITLSKINEKNSNLYIKEEIYKANDRSEKNNTIIKQNRPQTCAKHRKCRLSVSFLTKRISIPSFAKRETIPG